MEYTSVRPPCSKCVKTTPRPASSSKKAKLRWRVSNPQSSKYSLGWIPFKARALQYKAGQVAFAGQKLSLWDSHGLADYELRSGSFSQDNRGRWYLNIVVKAHAKPTVATASVGIDLGLKDQRHGVKREKRAWPLVSPA